jgi:hypothetical protein
MTLTDRVAAAGLCGAAAVVAFTGLLSTSQTNSPGSSGALVSTGGGEDLTTGFFVAGAVNCDCPNTTAPNIGGAAVRQCLKAERRLMQAITSGSRLVAKGSKITGASPYVPLCDSVAGGPAAWPHEGSPVKSPYQGQQNLPTCATPPDPNQRCVPKPP